MVEQLPGHRYTRRLRCLIAFNDEEWVTRDIILQADLVVNVVDAVHLKADLFLTLQLIDMGLPMVVVLNMMDRLMHNN